MGTLTETQTHLIVLLLNKQPFLLKLLFDYSSALEPLHAFKRTSVLVNQPVFSKYVDELEVVTLTYAIIVVVMGWSNLHTSSSELTVHHLISYNQNFSVWDEGMKELSAYKMFVSRILRMYSETSISKHSFNTSSCHLHKFCRVILKLIPESEHYSEFYFFLVTWHFNQSSFFDVDVFHLNIRNGSFQDRGPVHKSIGSVNQPFFIELHKAFSYGL